MREPIFHVRDFIERINENLESDRCIADSYSLTHFKIADGEIEIEFVSLVSKYNFECTNSRPNGHDHVILW